MLERLEVVLMGCVGESALNYYYYYFFITLGSKDPEG